MPLRLGIFGSTADKFMALAKESESFDEYSIEKRGSSVRLEKQIGQFQCSFCSEETDFYDVRFEDTHCPVPLTGQSCPDKT